MKSGQKGIFLSTTTLFWFAMYTYPVLLSTFVTEGLGGTPAMAGLVVGSYGFTQMVLRIPVGFLSDRLRRRKPFLIAGAACTLLAALGLYIAQSPVMALLARGLAGVAAAMWVCFTVLYGAGQPAGQQTRAMGTLSSVMYAGQLVATLLGGALAQAAGVQASFLLAAVAGGLGVVLATRVREKPIEGAPVTLRSITQALRDPLLLYCSGLSIVIQMVMWATLYGFSPSWAEQVLAADPAQLGLLSTVHLIPTILFSRLGAAYLVPRVGEKGTLMLGFGMLGLGCVLMPMTTAFWQMLCLQVLCGIGVGCGSPLLLALCTRNMPPERQGIAMGTYQSLYGIGMFIGPLLAGWLVEMVASGAGLTAGYRAVFFCAAALCALALVLSVWLPVKGKIKE